MDSGSFIPTKETMEKKPTLRKVLKDIFKKEYSSLGENLGVDYHDNIQFLGHFQRIYQKITRVKCRGLEFKPAIKDICNRLGCPMCWHRHYGNVRKALHSEPEYPTTIRVVDPFHHESFDRSLFTEFNMGQDVSLLAYAIYPDDRPDFLRASIIYKNLKYSGQTSGSMIKFIGSRELVKFTYMQAELPTTTEGVTWWAESIQPPWASEGYQKFLSLKVNVDSWLRLGRIKNKVLS